MVSRHISPNSNTWLHSPKLLWNSSASTIFPTFSSPLTLNHISPLMNSLPCQTNTKTFPHLFPTPCFLKQNPVPVIDTLLCFTFSVSDPSCSSTSPLVCWFPFLSHMLSSLESAAVPLPLRSTGSPFHFSFRLSCPFSLATNLVRFFLFLRCLHLPDSSWSMCHSCIVYKPLSPVSCSLASSMQFSLVSSLPRFTLWPHPSEVFPHLKWLS